MHLLALISADALTSQPSPNSLIKDLSLFFNHLVRNFVLSSRSETVSSYVFKFSSPIFIQILLDDFLLDFLQIMNKNLIYDYLQNHNTH